MKLQQTASLIEIDKIIVLPNRQRSAGFDTSDLQASISRLGGGRLNEGLLQPILVNLRLELQFGERRLTACRALGHTHILTRYAEDLTRVEAEVVELTENVKKQDLEWKDLVRAIARIHALHCSEDESWTQEDTAREVSLQPGSISMYLSVNRELDNPRVASAGGYREAFNVLKRRDQREAGNALDELLSAPDLPAEPGATGPGLPISAPNTPAAIAQQVEQEVLQRTSRPVLLATGPSTASPEESILQASFLDWAPTYSGPKFNLIHCDFPYGVGLGSGPQGRGSEQAIYEDTRDVYWRLVASLCEALPRVMSMSGHVMFWLSAETAVVSATLEYFGKHAPSLAWHKFPLIWGKTDNTGISSDPRMGPRHTYELCLLASRSSRQIVQVKSDFYGAPRDPRLHPSTKPEPMLRHFMTMLVDEHTSLLDPTCGSGAALRAAESLGAKRTLGLEIDQGYIGPARLALKQSRASRAAAAGGQ